MRLFQFLPSVDGALQVGFGVGPFGGVSLDAAHHLGNGNCVGHPREDVDVVGHAVDDQSVASFAVDHSG